MRLPRVRFTVRRIVAGSLALTIGVAMLWASGERLRRPRPVERVIGHPEDQASSTPANSDETVFLGTVTRIDNLGHPHPFLWWGVTLKIDKMI
jgi:hypothetical protein